MDIKKTLSELKKKKVKLVYWYTKKEYEYSQKYVKRFGGFLTGKKITYVKDLSKNSKVPEKNLIKIDKYKEKIPNNDLINLITQGGVYSRFYVDPKISEKKYKELHKQWITNSVKYNQVFIYKNRNHIRGFVSLNKKNQIGNIDFIVIEETYKRKGIATALMNHAHKWFISKGYKKVQADTQKNNINACKMYEKLGYYIEKSEDIYHFWL